MNLGIEPETVLTTQLFSDLREGLRKLLAVIGVIELPSRFVG
jgi:hypothetical protein